MSDNNNFFLDIMNFMAHGGATPKMAMTFNRKPSFTCSYIHSDQYFYADDEYDQTLMQFEDALDSDIEERMIPHALRQAKETSEGFITLGDAEFGLPLTDDLVALCRDALKPQEACDVNKAIEILQGSDLAREYLEFADKADISFETSAEVDQLAIDYTDNVIVMPQTVSDLEASLLMMRGVRALQMKDVRPLLQNPERAILLNRSIEAELACIPVHVAWELKLNGFEEAWNYISASGLSDLAYAFGHRASDDFRAIRDGRSAIAAFDQWFYSGRTRKADRAIIQTLLAAGDDVKEAQELSNTQVIEALRSIGSRSIMGKNYLVEHFMTLLEDGFYGEVRDRSNANFMWFVKFERSFREAEEQVEAKRASENTDMNTEGAVILAFPDIKKARRSKDKQGDAGKVHTLRV